MDNLKTIRDIQFLEGVKVLVRVDFNVLVENEMVRDDFRIKMALPTIDFLRSKKAKIILISHLESNSGEDGSLEPVINSLACLGQKATFVKDIKNAHEIIENKMANGDCILLENLRFFDGEKSNDKKFAQELASLSDIFVNEAFSTSHREHASIISIPSFLPSYAGLQFEKEVLNISKPFEAPHPFVLLLGGAKFDTKLPLIQRFSKIADTIFIGGALANDALKAKGLEVGKSKLSNGSFTNNFLVWYNEPIPLIC